MKKIEVRPNGTKRVYTVNEMPSKTDQSQKKSCDVNEIIAKYKRTGQVTHLAKNRGQYADVAEIPDLLTATVQVQKAQESFNSLPAHIRKRFQNNPIEFVNFMVDPENIEESVRLGLREKIKIEVSDQQEAPPVSGSSQESQT